MYHKVYVNSKELQFGNVPITGAKLISFVSVDSLYDQLHQNNHEIFFVQDNTGSEWQKFLSAHQLIEAAGGLVINGNEELLVIRRLGYWDLPKGKMEKDENPESAALREIEEECGLTGLVLKKKLNDTWHTYMLKGKRIIKQTHWFRVEVAGSPELTAQAEEDITEALWMNKEQVSVAVRETYVSLKSLFQSYLSGDE
jgi:8-oxo-dGTP pyrophosphatase MutT (NUDIX family)